MWFRVRVGRLAKFPSLNTKCSMENIIFVFVKHAFSSGNGAPKRIPYNQHNNNDDVFVLFSTKSHRWHSIDRCYKCSSTILDPELKAFAYLLLKKISVLLLIHYISVPRTLPIYIYMLHIESIYRSKSMKKQQIFYLYHYYHILIILVVLDFMCHCSK